MALNPIVFTEKVVRKFLRYQLTAYPLADARLHAQMRRLLSLKGSRQSPLLEGPYISLSRPFRRGAAIEDLVRQGLFHPHMRRRGAQSLISRREARQEMIRRVRNLFP